MKVHPSTISREFKRSLGQYFAERAEAHASLCRSTKRRRTIFTASLAKTIEDRLKKTWFPKQIAQSLKGKVPYFKTIYNWLYAGLIDLDLSVLRHKGKIRQPKETLGRFRLGTPISQRKQI